MTKEGSKVDEKKQTHSCKSTRSSQVIPVRGHWGDQLMASSQGYQGSE